jgi:hypothetical protein
MKFFLTLILLFISVRTFSHVGACTTPNHPGIGCMQTSSDFIQAIEAAKFSNNPNIRYNCVLTEGL